MSYIGVVFRFIAILSDDDFEMYTVFIYWSILLVVFYMYRNFTSMSRWTDGRIDLLPNGCVYFACLIKALGFSHDKTL